MFKEIPSKSFLDECFDYNPLTGLLMWKERPLSHFKSKSSKSAFNKIRAGTVAGNKAIGPSGKWYIKVMVSKTNYVAHRICAKMAGFDFSESDEIDHMDGNGLNNKKDNFRVVSNIENGKNRRLYSANSSGASGVHMKSNGKWQARINHKGKRISLGSFHKKEDAIEARKVAEIKYGYHKNHGSDRPL